MDDITNIVMDASESEVRGLCCDAGLNRRDTELLVLYFFYRLSPAEIARSRNTTIRNTTIWRIETKLADALKRARAGMERHGKSVCDYNGGENYNEQFIG